ncbi:hypothetical protein ACUN9V_09525 [Salinicola sp. V024]|uniref:hypothetical protein n=1 Tax=Salinicola sp. V024 TaxID=3459609 RepID=UPI004044D07D
MSHHNHLDSVLYVIRNFKTGQIKTGVCQYFEKTEILSEFNMNGRANHWEFMTTLRDSNPKFIEHAEVFFRLGVKRKDFTLEQVLEIVQSAEIYESFRLELEDVIYNRANMMSPRQVRQRKEENKKALN